MRKIRSFAAAVALLMALSACGGQRAESRSPGVSGSTVSGILTEASSTPVSEKAGSGGKGGDSGASLTPSDAAELDHSGVDSRSTPDGIDIDLTAMSSTMVFGQVSDMMYLPDDYVGKTIRMQGSACSVYSDETDLTYYYILIADAAACCAQGLEYVLAEGADYPEDGTEAVVTGVFELYDELGITYSRLRDAAVAA